MDTSTATEMWLSYFVGKPSEKTLRRRRGRTACWGIQIDQKRACLSHVEQIFLPLVFEMNYSRVDVFLETRQTPLFTHLLEWYGPYIKHTSHALSEYGTEASPYARVQKILEGDEYEALLLIRPDLILSPLFGCSLSSCSQPQ